MKRLLASLLLASSLTACAAASAAPEKPAPADTNVQLDRKQVRAKLAERRKEVIERFLAYREARVYPWNQTVPSVKHLWFDARGNLCAAATLISYDWGRPSTMKVGENNRELALANITRGELADWIATSGLTHHEIVAIQAPGFGIEIDNNPEVERLYAIYKDVERQLRTLGDENLDLATDALMKRPDLARKLLAGKLPGPGKYFVPDDAHEPVAPPADVGPLEG